MNTSVFAPFRKQYEVNNLYFLIVILFLATILRTYKLDYQSLWHDEIHSMNGASPVKSLDEVIEYSRHDQPPLHFIITHYWTKIFGFNDFEGRLPSALIGVIGALVMFFLGRELKSDRVGLIAAFITSINYFHILHSQEVRFYSLLFLLSALSYLFYLKSIRTQKLMHYLFYVLSTVALLYTHYFGLVVWMSQTLLFFVILFCSKRTTRFFWRGLFSGMAVLILITPWIPVFIHENTIINFWIEPLEPAFLIHYFFQYFRDFVSCILFVAVILYYVRYIILEVRKARRLDDQLIVLFGWIFLAFMIPIIYSLVKMPMLISRYTMIALPAIFLLIALGLNHLGSLKLQNTVMTAVFISSISGMFFFNKYYTEMRHQEFRAAARVTINENKDRNIVYSDHAWYFNYYFQIDSAGYEVYRPWERDYKSDLTKTDKVWVLSMGGTVFQPLIKELELQNFTIKHNFAFFQANAVLYKRMALLPLHNE